MTPPRVYVVSGPSGVGKTSLARRVVEITPGATLSVSHTTRERRPGETDGRHYRFVSREEFEALIRADGFIEYAEVFDHLYGTSREAIATSLEAGTSVVLDIDWQGARQVRRTLPEVCSIFVLPPSLDALRQRLTERRQDSDEVITRRMAEAVADMRHCIEYDHLVINDDFDAALTDLAAIIGGRSEDARPVSIDLDRLFAEPTAPASDPV